MRRGNAVNSHGGSGVHSGGHSSHGSGGGGGVDATHSRKHLANMRVIQRNLVYAIGLPLSMARNEKVQRAYFGQFGTVAKCVFNKNQLYNTNSSQVRSFWVVLLLLSLKRVLWALPFTHPCPPLHSP